MFERFEAYSAEAVTQGRGRGGFHTTDGEIDLSCLAETVTTSIRRAVADRPNVSSSVVVHWEVEQSLNPHEQVLSAFQYLAKFAVEEFFREGSDRAEKLTEAQELLRSANMRYGKLGTDTVNVLAMNEGDGVTADLSNQSLYFHASWGLTGSVYTDLDCGVAFYSNERAFIDACWEDNPTMPGVVVKAEVGVNRETVTLDLADMPEGVDFLVFYVATYKGERSKACARCL